MPEKYWFRVPNFEGRRIHVTPWREYGPRKDLPNPLVAAVREPIFDRFSTMDINTRLRYLQNHHDCIGLWIPSQKDFSRLENENIKALKAEYDQHQNPTLIDIMAENLETLFELHIPFSEDQENIYNLSIGVSNRIVSAVKYKKGLCWDKATLMYGFIGDTHPVRIVGYNQFDMDIWREIAASYPPFTPDGTQKFFPHIYHSGFRKNQETHEERGVFIPHGTVVKVDPDNPNMPRHFWIKVQMNGEEKEYDTVGKETRVDPSYQFIKSKIGKMLFDCPMCEIEGDKVISTTEPS